MSNAVIALWQRCGLTRPWNDPASDIAFARRGKNATILIGRVDGAIVATAMVGHDGHRGWVYYVAVDPDTQGKDFGRAIMAAAEDWLRGQGVTKVDADGAAGQHQRAGLLRQARLRGAGARHLREVARWPEMTP